MQGLPIFLALNGVTLLVACMGAGLVLWRVIVGQRRPEDWHLLHAGGTARGVMLIALAGVIQLVALPPGLLWLAALLVTWFAWASTLAMFLRALTGEAGFGLAGPPMGRAIFLLYASGAAAVFPGFAILIGGLLRAWAG